jgi:hypothetical protein
VRRWNTSQRKVRPFLNEEEEEEERDDFCTMVLLFTK